MEATAWKEQKHSGRVAQKSVLPVLMSHLYKYLNQQVNTVVFIIQDSLHSFNSFSPLLLTYCDDSVKLSFSTDLIVREKMTDFEFMYIYIYSIH